MKDFTEMTDGELEGERQKRMSPTEKLAEEWTERLLIENEILRRMKGTK